VGAELPCPSCGARLGGRAGCQAEFDRLSALAWTSPARGKVHNFVVDAYAMQHPEEYGKSAKSYFAHLTALCFAAEHADDARNYWKIARALDGKLTLEKPPLIASRGVTTIADVGAAASDEEHQDRVRAWGRAVWEAYRSQHALARHWLEMALRLPG
jgi:hypothetical protein